MHSTVIDIVDDDGLLHGIGVAFANKRVGSTNKEQVRIAIAHHPCS